MAAQPPRRRRRHQPPPENVELNPFENPNPIFSNVIIKAEETTFYCIKQHLARHSKYFESMFFDGFEEKDRNEVTLENVPAIIFDLFLKLTNGIGIVTDELVEGLLELGDYIDSAVPTRRAEEFLIRDSSKTTKEKLFFANEFNLETLMAHILSTVTNLDELNQLVPANEIDSLHSMGKAHILKKMYSLVGLGGNQAGGQERERAPQPEIAPQVPIEGGMEFGRVNGQHQPLEAHEAMRLAREVTNGIQRLQDENHQLRQGFRNIQAELHRHVPVQPFYQPYPEYIYQEFAGNANQPRRAEFFPVHLNHLHMHRLPAAQNNDVAWNPHPVNMAVGRMQNEPHEIVFPQPIWPEQNLNQHVPIRGELPAPADVRARADPYRRHREHRAD
ncbi:unnamed protein product [Caenorhabditis brenneri]